MHALSATLKMKVESEKKFENFFISGHNYGKHLDMKNRSVIG